MLIPRLNKNIYIFICIYTSWLNNSHADQDIEVKYFFQNIQINKSKLYFSSWWTFSARQTVDKQTTAPTHSRGAQPHRHTASSTTPQLSKHCQPSIQEMFLECCWMNMENAHVEDTNYKVQNKYKNRRSKHFPQLISIWVETIEFFKYWSIAGGSGGCAWRPHPAPPRPRTRHAAGESRSSHCCVGKVCSSSKFYLLAKSTAMFKESQSQLHY